MLGMKFEDIQQKRSEIIRALPAEDRERIKAEIKADWEEYKKEEAKWLSEFGITLEDVKRYKKKTTRLCLYSAEKVQKALEEHPQKPLCAYFCYVRDERKWHQNMT